MQDNGKRGAQIGVQFQNPKVTGPLLSPFDAFGHFRAQTHTSPPTIRWAKMAHYTKRLPKLVPA